VLRRLVELTNLYPAKDAEQWVPLTSRGARRARWTSRGTVNRVLNEEQRRGSVELRRGRTLIRQLDALQRRAR
jgi:hypothetical protein